MYYVPGNHEARLADYERWRNQLTESGVKVLDGGTDEIFRDSASIGIAGVKDPNFAIPRYGRTRGCTEEIKEKTEAWMKRELAAWCGGSTSLFRILISHRPELIRLYRQAGVDLALCGHAHGGQFRLPGIGGLFAPNQGILPKYTEGMYGGDGFAEIVSRGLGGSVFPLRLFNRPEIVALTLRRAALRSRD